jgi:SAM-dependent methyltransferase
MVGVAVPVCGETPADGGSAGADDRAAAATELDTALAEGQLDRALELAEEIAFAEQEEYFDALLQVVAILCRQGKKEEAVATVQSALDSGFWDFRRLLTDEALALINRDPDFRAMVRAAHSRQYIQMLDRPSRDAMQKPDQIMATLSFRPGERVADVGAGSGYFTIPVAKAVGPEGTVWAVDIKPTMLEHIEARLAEEDLGNVELVLAEPDDPNLPPEAVDTILMVDTMHYVRDRSAYGARLAAALAPGGRLVIIDFRYEPEAEREFAPPPEQQVAREDLDADMATAGFRVVASHDFLPEQYFVVYQK